MKPEAKQALNKINRAFYEVQGAVFASKRTRAWAGWLPIINRLQPGDRVLDLGCGHGRFAQALEHAGIPGLRYLGIDASRKLLDLARAGCTQEWARFQHGDVVERPLSKLVTEGDFALVTLFGVLHHVPGNDARRALVAAAVDRLRPNGLLALSLWCFDRSPRFPDRRLDPQQTLRDHPSLAPGDLEPGDHFLGFDGRDSPARYCHFSNEREIQQLMSTPGAAAVARFVPERGDTLNEYLLLQRRS